MGCISDLPDEIACHILSFLTTREAALASVLSKRWRYLFAFTPNLRFEEKDFVYRSSDVDIPSSFRDFLDRVLATSGNSPIKKFSLKYRDSVVSDHTNRWICNVLSRGALARHHLDVISKGLTSLPLEIFTCKTLVKLKLGRDFVIDMIPENASLPALKTLFLDRIRTSNRHRCPFEALLSASPVLEELVMRNLYSVGGTHFKVSSRTLQRLTLHCPLVYRAAESSSRIIRFDTPGLAYLDYYGYVPKEYLVVNLTPSLKLSLTIYGYKETIPVLKNLLHLSITTTPNNCWRALPLLLNKSPNLETLVINGPLHYEGCPSLFEQRESVCECLSGYSCLLSCTVKILEISLYGKIVLELEQLKHFLEKLSCLELLKVRSWATEENQKSQLTTEVLNLPRSSKCEIQFEFIPS
ncbi:unnamed protein product [Microthlaspi erraticum]|uniref:F-box domain-containing protein n=1 Tax=Microthlaspi erraticum TaxID=1685480 RepID=A0A6D2HLA2_9BRAS|nr:unnamed protein product [Microthlaspi erraticum]